jgi:hypothetical protein
VAAIVEHELAAECVDEDPMFSERIYEKMYTDEEGTLERLKALRRELLDPKIAEHKGRIVKTTGDGLLVEFPSVVDTVRCAVEVQQAMAARNSGVEADKGRRQEDRLCRGRCDFRGLRRGRHSRHPPGDQQPDRGAARRRAQLP